MIFDNQRLPDMLFPKERIAMHKSKLAGFIIDCETQDLKSAAAFHQINPQKLTGEKLFWKSKLKVADSDPKQS